jgi:hypothetical protein
MSVWRKPFIFISSLQLATSHATHQGSDKLVYISADRLCIAALHYQCINSTHCIATERIPYSALGTNLKCTVDGCYIGLSRPCRHRKIALFQFTECHASIHPSTYLPTYLPTYLLPTGHCCNGKVVQALNYALCYADVGGGGWKDPRFLNLGTTWRSVVRFTPSPLWPRG